MSENGYSSFEMEVVQRLTRIESTQKTTLDAFNEHLKWSDGKSKEMDAKLVEYDAFNTKLKTYGSMLGFVWLSLQGWILHKLGFGR